MAESVILITGADNGIGFHLAASLLEDGYRVAGLDLSGGEPDHAAGDLP
jgi:NAD(P)-dependent dehydrogenase (short-subunit alcohol dehydrogenase family)